MCSIHVYKSQQYNYENVPLIVFNMPLGPQQIEPILKQILTKQNNSHHLLKIFHQNIKTNCNRFVMFKIIAIKP